MLNLQHLAFRNEEKRIGNTCFSRYFDYRYILKEREAPVKRNICEIKDWKPITSYFSRED